MNARIPPPIVALICVALMFAIAQIFDALWVAPVNQILAAVLIPVGLLIDIAAVLQFRRAKTTVNPLRPERAEQLVVSGLFRFSRNPMYLGLLLVLAGIAAYLGRWQGLIGPALFLVWINRWQIEPEEHAMRNLFAEQYDEYCRRVPRWLGPF